MIALKESSSMCYVNINQYNFIYLPIKSAIKNVYQRDHVHDNIIKLKQVQIIQEYFSPFLPLNSVKPTDSDSLKTIQTNSLHPSI